MIEVLQCFLYEHLINQQIQGITIPTIIALVRVILENQYILCDKKVYQQIQGSGFKSPLTTILANIYMYYWQKDLVTILDNKNEIFVKSLDEIFFTWNESEERLSNILNTMNRHYPTIRRVITINKDINYLDVNITHISGNLTLQVAHNINIEPYSLPFGFGRQRYKYKTLFRIALIPAIRCYTNVSDFTNKLQHLQLSFRHDRFVNDFIISKFLSFLEEFNADEMKLHNGKAY
ncbi:unnamed protein product [Rotaria sp. Silwood2]|nr:unnamed protein product [Rotaria sp. Silwood2]CAF2955437.1 unnamed protein product [Rotaria sp. Silwood2]CAF3467029.1 unnamed protein product [Rotaria sp. Silwood2]CAF3955707.1 unnamed protein product [Rotaria sp. Silwood2]CAF3956088.1 unnamed protein product [Rotaria sp. Silwood2]